MQYVNMSYEWYYDHFEEVAPRSLQVFGYSSEPVKVVRALRDYYFPKREITASLDDWVNLTMVLISLTL